MMPSMPLVPLLLLLSGAFGGSRASPNFGLMALLVLIQEQKRLAQADKEIVQEFITNGKITKSDFSAPNDKYKSHKALYDKLPADIQSGIEFSLPSSK